MIRYDDVVALLVGACTNLEGSPERAAIHDAEGEYIRVTGFVTHLIRPDRRCEVKDAKSTPGESPAIHSYPQLFPRLSRPPFTGLARLGRSSDTRGRARESS